MAPVAPMRARVLVWVRLYMRGVAWRGVAWRGVAWCGVAWRGAGTYGLYVATWGTVARGYCPQVRTGNGHIVHNAHIVVIITI